MTAHANYDIKDGYKIYARLLNYVTSYRWLFVVAVIAMAFYAATDAGLAALMKPMLDGVFVDKDPQWIKLIPWMILGIAVVRGLAGFVSVYTMSWIGRRVIKELRRQMFDHILRLPASFYDVNASGQLLSKFTYDVEQVAHATTNAITIVIRDSLTIIGLMAWMFYLSGSLTLVFLVIGPVMALLVNYVNKRFRRISTRIQHSMGDVSSVSEEAITGHRVIKTFGGREYEAQHFEDANEINRWQHMKMIVTSALSVNFIQIIAAGGLAFIVYLVTGPINMTISVGSFMSFITAMMMLMSPLKRLTTVNVSIQRSIAAANSVFGLLDCELEKDTGTERLEKARGAVEYANVVFAYDKHKGNVLNDISFKIEPGQTIAFVGRSGSGKTSIVSLLPRFYDIASGRILIDGQDIQSLQLDNLRDQIALVGQEVTLFNDSIAHNIAYGRLENMDKDNIVRAAEIANAMEFIRELPEGLDTIVGENGVLLSGGQRQRLAIARAVLKDAPILILDEATSALDSESEYLIQTALENLMKNRTTLVIAHRLSTIEKADMIMVMHNGSIAESGKHDELLAEGSLYANIYNMQFHLSTDKTNSDKKKPKRFSINPFKKGQVG